MERLIKEIKIVAKELVKLGWAPANAGNFSILLDTIPADCSTSLGSPVKLEGRYPALCGAYILMKIRGATMDELSKNPERYLCVVRIDTESTATIWQLKPLPDIDIQMTSEYKIHLSILNLSLKKNKPYKAILHTHPNNLSSVLYYLSGRGKEKFLESLYKNHPQIAMFFTQEIGVVSYAPPGSIELAEKVLKVVGKNHTLIIMRRHGCVAINLTLSKALKTIKLVFDNSLLYIP